MGAGCYSSGIRTLSSRQPFAEGFSHTVASAIADLPQFPAGNQFPNQSENTNCPIESDSLLPSGNATFRRKVAYHRMTNLLNNYGNYSVALIFLVLLFFYEIVIVPL
ncbi:MAG: hypothetical protein LBG58_11450 [Planctomycetaceae bacterium]|nr:hypothetical protein [Planctomycetaceae bacterium]